MMRQLDRPSIRGFFGLDFGKELLQQKANITVAKAIVFVTPVETIECGAGIRSRYFPVHYKHTDRHRHFFSVN